MAADLPDQKAAIGVARGALGDVAFILVLLLLLGALEVLADDLGLHPLLPVAAREPGPLERCGAKRADRELADREEDAGEADARGEKHPDQERGHQDDRAPGAVEARGDRSVDLAAEVAAGGDERAADPDLVEREVEKRRKRHDEHQEAEQLRVDVLDLPSPETVPSDREERDGKERPGEPEEADQDPGERRAVVADRVARVAVAGGVERGGIVGKVREREAAAITPARRPDADSSTAAPAGKKEESSITPITPLEVKS